MLRLRLRINGRCHERSFSIVAAEAKYAQKGKIVKLLGSYKKNKNTNTFDFTLDIYYFLFYYFNGAELSPRLVKIFKTLKIDLVKDWKTIITSFNKIITDIIQNNEQLKKQSEKYEENERKALEQKIIISITKKTHIAEQVSQEEKTQDEKGDTNIKNTSSMILRPVLGKISQNLKIKKLNYTNVIFDEKRGSRLIKKRSTLRPIIKYSFTKKRLEEIKKAKETINNSFFDEENKRTEDIEKKLFNVKKLIWKNIITKKLVGKIKNAKDNNVEEKTKIKVQIKKEKEELYQKKVKERFDLKKQKREERKKKKEQAKESN